MTCHIRRKEGPRSCWAIKHNADNLALFQFFLGSHRRCNLPHKSQSQQKSLSVESGTEEQKSRLSQGPSPTSDGQNQQLNPPQPLPSIPLAWETFTDPDTDPFFGRGCQAAMAKGAWPPHPKYTYETQNTQRSTSLSAAGRIQLTRLKLKL